MTKILLPAITDEMTPDQMKSAKLHFEGLGFSMPGWSKASRDRKLAWLRKTFADSQLILKPDWASQADTYARGAITFTRPAAMGKTESMLPWGEIIDSDGRPEDGSIYDLKTIVEKVDAPGVARKLGAKMMDFTAAVIKFVMGEQTSPDTAIPLLGRLMVNANMNFASGLKRGEPSPANLRAANRRAGHRKAQKARLSASAQAEDFTVSRQVRRHMMRIAAKFERTERKEEALSSRAMGGAAAVA